MTNRRLLVLAAASLALGACGSSTPVSQTTRTVTVTPSAPTTTSNGSTGSTPSTGTTSTTASGTVTSSSAPGPSASGAVAPSGSVAPSATPSPAHVVADPAVLASARVPASCQHAAGRLRGYALPVSDPSQGFGQIATRTDDNGFAPLAVDLDGDGQDELLADYGCSAGGVSWPDYVLAYDARGTLRAGLSLGDVQQAEHVQVRSARRQGHAVRLRLRAYEGAGFDVRELTIVVRLKGSTLTWAQVGPTTALSGPGQMPSDAATGSTPTSGGGGLTQR